MRHGGVISFQQEREGFKFHRIFPGKMVPQLLQMRGGKCGDADVSHEECVPGSDRREVELERHQFLENICGIQHTPHWFQAFLRHVHGEIACALIEPKALHQHKKTTYMVAMQMAEKDAVEFIRLHACRPQAAAYWFAAVHQQRTVAQVKQKRGMPATIAGPAITGA